MDGAGQLVGQGLIDQAVHGYPCETCKARRHDLDGEMALALRTRARMTRMQMTVIGDLELQGCQALLQDRLDTLFDRAHFSDLSALASLPLYPRAPIIESMSEAFNYKPRFKDIRIKPPKDEPSPEERVCEWPGCRKHGDSRAPKSSDQLNSFYWFCQSHASEYNKSWNFFEGMGEGEAQAFRESAAYGHRPTWSWRNTHSASARASKASRDFADGFDDPYGVFGNRQNPHKPEEPREAPMGRLQSKALETMGLEASAEPSSVRKRYAELVKRYHPDANGGDRSSEEHLGRVIAAYQILKNAGMA